MSRRKSKQTAPLLVRELAVDPGDVDNETYPVTLRLSRRMSANEVTALAGIDGGWVAEGDSIVIHDARLDDVAHAHSEWAARLETVQRLADELSGEALLADQRRDDHLRAAGGHLGDRHDPYSMG